MFLVSYYRNIKMFSSSKGTHHNYQFCVCVTYIFQGFAGTQNAKLSKEELGTKQSRDHEPEKLAELVQRMSTLLQGAVYWWASIKLSGISLWGISFRFLWESFFQTWDLIPRISQSANVSNSLLIFSLTYLNHVSFQKGKQC